MKKKKIFRIALCVSGILILVGIEGVFSLGTWLWEQEVRKEASKIEEYALRSSTKLNSDQRQENVPDRIKKYFDFHDKGCPVLLFTHYSSEGYYNDGKRREERRYKGNIIVSPYTHNSLSFGEIETGTPLSPPMLYKTSLNDAMGERSWVRYGGIFDALKNEDSFQSKRSFQEAADFVLSMPLYPSAFSPSFHNVSWSEAGDEKEYHLTMKIGEASVESTVRFGSEAGTIDRITIRDYPNLTSEGDAEYGTMIVQWDDYRFINGQFIPLKSIGVWIDKDGVEMLGSSIKIKYLSPYYDMDHVFNYLRESSFLFKPRFDASRFTTKDFICFKTRYILQLA